MAGLEDSASRNPVEALAEEFLERRRRGEDVSIAEYAKRHPQYASEIEAFFEMVLQLEGLRPRVPGAARETRTLEGTSLADYSVQSEIGRGGMGVVYEAWQESLGRRVALKVLPSRGARANAVERFQVEARAAARLHHTNIVPVYDVGQEDDVVYYAMQYIQGSSLQEALQQVRDHRESSTHKTLDRLDYREYLGSPSQEVDAREQSYARRAAELARQAASALEYAHSQGVLHRDIKPGNLLLDEEGLLWIADFGLAKLEDTPLTESGDLLGTWRYMSPERFQGECDASADVYALGVTLYELLSLRPAFSAPDQASLVDQIQNSTPLALRQLDSTIPPDLEAIVRTAMAPSRGNRYASARNLRQDLERFLDDRPIETRRSTPRERLVRWSRRHRGLATCLYSILLVLLLTSGWLGLSTFEFQQAATREIALRQDASWNLYRMRMVLGQSASESPSGIARLRDILAETLPHPGEIDLRGWEWYHLHALAYRETRTWPDDRMSRSVRWFPDGRHLVIASPRCTCILDSRTGEEVAVLPAVKGAWTAVAVSPDGQRVLCASDALYFSIFEGPEWSHRRDLPIHGPTIQSLVDSVDWDPSGRYLVFALHGSAVIWDDQKEQIVFTREHHRMPIHRFSPDGRHLAIELGKSISILQVGTWTAVAEFPYEAAPKNRQSNLLMDMDWSPDGQHFLAAFDIGVWVRRIDDPDDELWIPSSAWVETSSWSPVGDLIATAGRDSSVRLWDARDGRLLAQWPGAGKNWGVHALEWHPSRRALLSSSDDGLRLWDLDEVQPFDEIRTCEDGHEISAGQIHWLEDNRHVLLTHDRVELWDTRLGELVWSRPGHSAVPIPGTDEIVHATAEELIWVNREGTVLQERRLAGVRALSFTEQPPGIAVLTASQLLHLDPAMRDQPREVLANVQATHLAASPQPGFVVIASQGRVQRCDLDTGQILDSMPHAGACLGLQWSSDRTALAVLGSQPGLDLRDGLSLEPRSLLSGPTSDTTGASWSPDHRRLAVSTVKGEIYLWDTAREDIVLHIEEPSPAVAIAWSPDGQRLATLLSSGALRVRSTGPEE